MTFLAIWFLAGALGTIPLLAYWKHQSSEENKRICQYPQREGRG